MADLPKILIVDDKIENLIALEKLIGGFNAVTVRALSGNEALQHTLNHRFALALVDVQMPEMDGFETVNLMRSSQETRYMPVIFVSALYRDDYHVAKGIESGAVDFITKPINPEILKGKVKIFLELYEQKIQLEDEIAERQKSEKQVMEYNTLLRGLFGSIPDLVFYKNLQGIYLGCNRAFEEFVEKKEADIVGGTDQDIFSHTISTELSNLFQKAVKSQLSAQSEIWTSSRMHGNILLDIVNNPLINDAGHEWR